MIEYVQSIKEELIDIDGQEIFNQNSAKRKSEFTENSVDVVKRIKCEPLEDDSFIDVNLNEVFCPIKDQLANKLRLHAQPLLIRLVNRLHSAEKKANTLSLQGNIIQKNVLKFRNLAYKIQSQTLDPDAEVTSDKGIQVTLSAKHIKNDKSNEVLGGYAALVARAQKDVKPLSEINADMDYGKIVSDVDAPSSGNRYYKLFSSDEETSESKIERLPKVPRKIKVKKQIVPRTGQILAKRPPCLFCGKPVDNFLRHILTHDKQYYVKKLVSLDKGSDERKKLLDNMMKKAYQKAIDARKKRGKGKPSLVNFKRTARKKTDSFMTCKTCRARIRLSEKSSHKCVKKSQGNPAPSKKESGKCCTVVLTDALVAKGDISKEFVEKCLGSMQKDDIFKVIVCDSLILRHGMKLFQFHGAETVGSCHEPMRTLGTLLKTVNLKTPETSLFDLLTNEGHFEAFFDGIKEMTGWLTDVDIVENPGQCIKLGYTINELVDMVKSDALQTDTAEMISKFEDHRSLVWPVISSKCLRSLSISETEKLTSTNLPIEEDIARLLEYCIDTTTSILVSIHQGGLITPEKWRLLGQCTLTRLFLLNNRRGEEVSSMRIDEFQAASQGENVENEKVKSLHDPLEKVLSKDAVVAYVHGNRAVVGKKLFPVIIPEDTVEAVQCTIEMRPKSEVDPQNQFVFALPRSAKKIMKCHDVLLTVGRKAGCIRPDLLLSIKVRKRVCTLIQVLYLRPNEKRKLLRLLGHNEEKENGEITAPEVSWLAKALIDADKSTIKRAVRQTFTASSVTPVSIPKKKETVPTARKDAKPVVIDGLKWTQQETEHMKNYFAECITEGRAPKRDEIDDFIFTHKLYKFTWKQVKNKVWNTIRTRSGSGSLDKD